MDFLKEKLSSLALILISLFTPSMADEDGYSPIRSPLRERSHSPQCLETIPPSPTLTSTSPPPPPPPSSSIEGEGSQQQTLGAHECNQCGASFKSMKALWLHTHVGGDNPSLCQNTSTSPPPATSEATLPPCVMHSSTETSVAAPPSQMVISAPTITSGAMQSHMANSPPITSVTTTHSAPAARVALPSWMLTSSSVVNAVGPSEGEGESSVMKKRVMLPDLNEMPPPDDDDDDDDAAADDDATE